MAFSIAEPAPTPLPNHYTPAGRGGAGNMYKPSSSPSLTRSTTASSSGSTLSKSSSSSTTSSLGKSSTVSSSSSTARVFAGRGGAGNVRPRAEEEPFSFAEEVREQTRREAREKTWVVGRGGAGNWATKGDREGEKRGLLGRIGEVLSRA
ncbi:hypothetical protein VC83_06161 [Pseudogymnoascus destructans]|uniref:Uncharacterized protein n=2 Tax=Pseudogymnoascus destructans TaxID=655981 RepID=L8G5T7_PSED2|nr:uncharacterized protein VC83_06161 [Pseudogymnoascus destructans]ELR07336.1 hypothetical protein GMDG_02516 [Pseudogymnoascus destructans 20631-21]OAF59025.1 hypothetical protein VC83_06161 [Pseudogymnoascus destructans]